MCGATYAALVLLEVEATALARRGEARVAPAVAAADPAREAGFLAFSAFLAALSASTTARRAFLHSALASVSRHHSKCSSEQFLILPGATSISSATAHISVLGHRDSRRFKVALVGGLVQGELLQEFERHKGLGVDVALAGSLSGGRTELVPMRGLL